MKAKPKFKLMWLVGGKLYCSKKCSGGGIPFAFAPVDAECGDSLKSIARVPKYH